MEILYYRFISRSLGGERGRKRGKEKRREKGRGEGKRTQRGLP